MAPFGEVKTPCTSTPTALPPAPANEEGPRHVMASLLSLRGAPRVRQVAHPTYLILTAAPTLCPCYRDDGCFEGPTPTRFAASVPNNPRHATPRHATPSHATPRQQLWIILIAPLLSSHYIGRTEREIGEESSSAHVYTLSPKLEEGRQTRQEEKLWNRHRKMNNASPKLLAHSLTAFRCVQATKSDVANVTS